MADESRSTTDVTSRRAVVRAVAWTTPVVAVAAAAPAFATSMRNDISDPVYTLTSSSTLVQVTDISVTNDGPSTLPARSVSLRIASFSDRMANPSATGSWIPDPSGSTFGAAMTFLYDAPVPVGTSVPLIGSVRAIVDTDAGLNFNVSLFYLGLP